MNGNHPRVAGALVGLAAGCTVDPVAAGEDSGAWFPRASLNVARQECGAARIADRVYVVGGLLAGLPIRATATVEAYHIVADSWSLVTPMPDAIDHMGVSAANGRLYVFGGYSGDFEARDRVLMYAPETDQWSDRAPLPQPRGACWAVTLGGRVYVLGGADANGNATRTVFVYDPATDSWSQRAGMNIFREHLTAAVVDDHIFVIGGRDGAPIPITERYDPLADAWEVVAPMPTARSAMGTAAIGGRIFVAGGEVPQLFDVNEVYDVATDAWSVAAPMPVPRHGLAAVALGDRILMPGGGTIQGLRPTAHVDLFLPQVARAVPALSIRAAGAMAGLLLVAGYVVLRQRRRVEADRAALGVSGRAAANSASRPSMPPGVP
jgi:N-acetylneuraminic acid mutarotase